MERFRYEIGNRGEWTTYFVIDCTEFYQTSLFVMDCPTDWYVALMLNIPLTGTSH